MIKKYLLEYANHQVARIDTPIGKLSIYDMKNMPYYRNVYIITDNTSLWLGTYREPSEYFLYAPIKLNEDPQQTHRSTFDLTLNFIRDIKTMKYMICEDEIFDIVDRLVDHPRSKLPKDYKRYPPVKVNSIDDDSLDVWSALNIISGNITLGGIGFKDKDSEPLKTAKEVELHHEILLDVCVGFVMEKLSYEGAKQ